MVVAALMWTRVKCKSSEVTSCNDSTKVVLTDLLDHWSNTVYLKGTHAYLLRNVNFDLSGCVKATSKKTGKRYIQARKMKLVVDRAFVMATLKEKIHWNAGPVVAHFEESQSRTMGGDPERLKTGGDDDAYAFRWMEHIEGNRLETTCSGARHLLDRLKLISLSRFTSVFETALVEVGLSEPDTKKLAGLLDLDISSTVDPQTLANQWVSRPYNHYLKGLSETNRTRLGALLAERGGAQAPLDLEGERTRCIVHELLEKQEMNGSTYVSLEQIHSELKRFGITAPPPGVLVIDDLFTKPTRNKLKFQRDPTLVVIQDRFIQHRDVSSAEDNLLSYWSQNGEKSGGSGNSGAVPSFEFTTLNREQKTALSNVFRYKISCITGGPGTGKTHVAQIVCDKWKKLTGGGPVVVVSSYHQPLKNLEHRMAGAPSLVPPNRFKTISSCVHSPKPLFWTTADGTAETKEPPLPALLVIEEAGVSTMVDLYAIFQKALATSVSNGDGAFGNNGNVSIVMLGDDKQLKPIGAGQPFSEFINFYPEYTTRLKKNMRTDCPNLCSNIASICSGRSELQQGSDFVWRQDVPLLNAASYEATGEAFFQTYLSEFDLGQDVVIVQKNEVRQLLNQLLHNKHLRQLVANHFVPHRSLQRLLLAPSFSTKRFVPGTRVVCRETSSDLKLTNGTRGTVKSTGNDDRVVVTGADHRIYDYPPKLWELGYSLTCHKAQGSEYDSPFIYSYNDYFVARDWLYTAVSRAKMKVTYLVPKSQHVVATTVHKVRESLSLMKAKKSKKRKVEEERQPDACRSGY